jgi:uncharacterized RDD family membrane protein YckC
MMELNQQPHSEEQNLFDDFTPQLVQASSGKRFANYIIDLIGFSVFMYFFSYILVAVSYNLAAIVYGDDHPILGRLVFVTFYGMYMGFIEAIFKGRSLGKLITRTIVVNEDGSRISVQTALRRGLSRAVPFEAFSALGTRCYPWHDRWNKTYVVNYTRPA